MRTLNIAGDFDGVVTCTNSLKAYYILNWYGVIVPLAQCRKKYIVANGLLTNDQYNRVRDKVVATNTGILADSMPGALAYISRLRRDGHFFNNIITTRRNKGVKIAQKWFEVRNFDIKVVGVGNDTKARAARGLDIFVDDDLEKLEPLVDVVKHLFLFSNSVNERDNEKDIAKRIFSWEDLYQEIKFICQDLK